MSLALIIAFAVTSFLLISKCIMVVPEGTVLKTFRLGKTYKSFGPGLHIGWFDLVDKIKLSIGTTGIATSESTFEINGYQIDVKYSESPRIGAPARIEKFEGIQPLVTQINVPTERIVRCEKCGHHNKLQG